MIEERRRRHDGIALRAEGMFALRDRLAVVEHPQRLRVDALFFQRAEIRQPLFVSQGEEGGGDAVGSRAVVTDDRDSAEMAGRVQRSRISWASGISSPYSPIRMLGLCLP